MKYLFKEIFRITSVILDKWLCTGLITCNTVSGALKQKNSLCLKRACIRQLKFCFDLRRV